MTKERAIEEAERIAAKLEQNSDDVHFRRVDWETFSARNEVIWREAEADRTVVVKVLGILRKDPNWKEEEA